MELPRCNSFSTSIKHFSSAVVVAVAEFEIKKNSRNFPSDIGNRKSIRSKKTYDFEWKSDQK